MRILASLLGLSLLVSGIAPQQRVAAQQPSSPPAAGGAQSWQHGSVVTFVGFRASGKQLVTASQDGLVRVWEVATGKEVRRFGKEQKVEPAPATFALSPDGRLLAVAGQDGTIRLWETETGKAIRTLEAPRGGQARPVSLAISPDGKHLAVRGQEHDVRVYDLGAGKSLGELGDGPDPKLPGRLSFAGGAATDNSLAFSPDSKTLVTVGVGLDDQQFGLVQFWKVATGEELRQVKVRQPNPFFDVRTGFGVAGLVFALDGKVLLACASSDGTARLYEPTADKELRRLVPVQFGVHVVFAFAPDGKMLAARTSNSSAIRLSDLTTGKERILGDEAKWTDEARMGAAALAFAPDGKLLAEGIGTRLRLWDVASGKEVHPGQQGR